MLIYFTGLSEVEVILKDHQVQLLGEWPTQGWNPQPWFYWHHALASWANLGVTARDIF